MSYHTPPGFPSRAPTLLLHAGRAALQTCWKDFPGFPDTVPMSWRDCFRDACLFLSWFISSFCWSVSSRSVLWKGVWAVHFLGVYMPKNSPIHSHAWWIVWSVNEFSAKITPASIQRNCPAAFQPLELQAVHPRSLWVTCTLFLRNLSGSPFPPWYSEIHDGASDGGFIIIIIPFFGRSSGSLQPGNSHPFSWRNSLLLYLWQPPHPFFSGFPGQSFGSLCIWPLRWLLTVSCPFFLISCLLLLLSERLHLYLQPLEFSVVLLF